MWKAQKLKIGKCQYSDWNIPTPFNYHNWPVQVIFKFLFEETMVMQNKFEPIVAQAARYRRHFFCIRFIGLDFSPLVKNCQSNSLADTTFHNLTIVIFNLFCHRPRITICFVLFVCWAKIEKNGGQPCKFKGNLLHILWNIEFCSCWF